MRLELGTCPICRNEDSVTGAVGDARPGEGTAGKASGVGRHLLSRM